MVSTPENDRALETLRRNGRSFHWAGRLMAPTVRVRCARLYAICRSIDDMADLPVTADAQHIARTRLGELITALGRRDTTHPVVAEADRLLTNDENAWCALERLAATALTDIGPVRINNDDELYTYADGVAGTVGLMMAGMLDARDSLETRAAARALGVAMQFTNIARDVLADAQQNRVYLPRNWLDPQVTPDALATGNPQARASAWRAVQTLLEHAETSYESGWKGLPDLPPRSRLAIAVASHLYRRIGRRILARGPELFWRGRYRVGTGGKVLASAQGLSLYMQTCLRTRNANTPEKRNMLPNGRRDSER